MLKSLFSLLLFITFCNSVYSQILSWSGFPNGGTSYTTGIMTATVTSASPGFQNGTPRFIAGTTNGNAFCSLANSLELEHMFGNITNAHSTLTLDFTSGGTTTGLCGSITFKIKDINSDESFQTFADWVEVNAIDGNNAAIPVTNITAPINAGQSSTTSGNTRIVKGYSTGSYGSRSTNTCTDVTFTITAPAGGTLKTAVIKYHPDYTTCPNCYYNFTGPNRPAYQYISIGPITVTNSSSTPTISASGPTTFCTGGSVTLTSSSATGNTWSNGATTQSITVSTAGSYTVSVNSGGCIGTSAATVVTVNNPNSISNKTATICSGGTYNFTASSGDVVPAGTTYSWSFVNNPSISGATSGNNLSGISQTLTNNSSLPQTIVYTVTPTSNGCSGTPFNITITVNAPLNGGTISADQSICPNTTPSILNNVTFASGGSGLGLINSVQIGNQIWMNTNLDVLNYTDGQVIGTDFTQAVGAYTWYNNDQPTYGVYAPLYNWFAVNTNKLCPTGWKVPNNNDWLILMNFLATNQGNKLKSCRQVNSPLGGNCNVTALPRWDSHNSQFGTNDVGFSALPAGRREISNFLYTGTRATFWSADNFTPGINGSSHYVNLAVNLATAEYSDFIDYYTSSRWGLSVRCLANNTSNVNTSYTYQWQVDPGCTGNWTNIPGANAASYQPGVLSQTTCYRRLTIDTQCGTVNSNIVTISMIPTVTPTITANGSTTICQGGSVTLTSSSATGNTWSTGATTQSITVSAAGSYTVSVNSGGCTSTSAATVVTVNSNPTTPTISTSGSTTFCQGGSITLTSSSATGNTWSTGETTQSITVSASGNYSVTVGSAGCTAVSATTVVTVNPNPPTPTITTSGSLTFCAGGSVTLISSAATGNTWSTGETTQSITVSAAGSYTVSVNSGACTSTSAATVVTVNSNPTTPTISTSGSTTFCQGGSITLTSSSATGNTWSTGETTQSITVSASGNYSVTVDSAGCTAVSATTIVTVNPNPPTPTITTSGSLTFCAGGSVTLTSSATTGNTWSTGETTQSIIISAAGSFTVSVNSGACTSTSAATIVTVNSNPTTPTISSSGPTTFCQGGSITLTSSSATGNTWSTGETTQSITVSASGTYSVTAGSAGCTAVSATTVVTVNPNPATPTITTSGSLTFCTGGSVTLTSSAATGNTWSTGETTQSIIISAAGSYTVSVNSGGCTSTSAATVVTVNSNPTTPTISASGPTTICQGGSVTLTSSSATGNTWSTGETTQSITVSASGTYTVSYIDANGCISATASQVVSVSSNPAIPTISSSGSTTFCQGGSVTLTSSEVSGNTWSTGETTQSIIVNSSGNYSVTVGASGCSATSSTTAIIVNPLPTTPTITTSQTNLCAGQTATLTSSSATGNTWSTGTTAQTITISTAGTYILNVTDASGCISVNDSITITANAQPTAPSITASGPLTFCAGGSVVLTSSETTGNNWSTGETTQSITVTTSGTYSLTYTSNGCTSASVFELISVNSNPSTPTVTPSDPITFCQGGSVTLTSSASSGNTWSNGATSQSIVVNASGSYTVTVGASGCSSTSAAVVVTTNPLPPTPTITASQTSICTPQTATLTSSSPSGNTWSTGATSNSISVSTSGTYTLTTTDANGCVSAIASVIINANPQPNAPTITANGPTTFCAGGSVTLSSSQATGNTWSTGATTQTIVVTTSGTYTLTYLDANGCTSAIASQTVSVNSNPSVPTVTASGPTTFCTSGSVTLSSSAASGNTWSTGATTQTITVSTAGTYSVTVGASGCSATSNTITVTVNQNPATPTITASQLTLCAGQTATLTSNSTAGNTWSTGETTQSISVSSPGTYTVNTTANGCTSANATITISAGIAPTVTVNSASICTGQTATLTATPSVTGGTYLWSPGGSTNSTISISPNTTTSYSVIYTLNGCASAASSGTVNVSSGNTVTFSANNLTGCAPLTVNFTNLTPGTPTNCLWTLGNGVTLNGCNATYTFTTPGCYDVTLSNTVGGCSGTQTIADYICVTASPNASFSMNPSVFSTSPQNINFINNSSNATGYEWNFGDGSTSVLANPSHIYNNTETGYTVTLTATNAAGCADVFSVSLGSTDGLVYYIPNTFTPDGDGYNQTFQPVFTSGFDPFNFQMLIYNRWGELIFESYDASKGWDGSYGTEGGLVQDGTYTYKITFKNPKLDERITIHGHVNLIR